MSVEQIEQREIVVDPSTRNFFLESFRDAWKEHMGPRRPGSDAEYERRAAVAARVEVWQTVFTHLGMSEEMGIIKLEVMGIKPEILP